MEEAESSAFFNAHECSNTGQKQGLLKYCQLSEPNILSIRILA